MIILIITLIAFIILALWAMIIIEDSHEETH